jgi:UDP-N-acetylglucosamine--N-acetylmuramyl-(pentapeptide) pyrophosphoryl-undecaprenol N-acetylglucosamine transferase
MAEPLVFFAGGGTGGHLFPGLAVADRLRERGVRAVFIGSERVLERGLIARHGYEQRALPAESLTAARRRPLRFMLGNWRAYRLARQWVRSESPAVVVGLGGFASVPIALAASRTGVPLVLLEQNAVPGKATHWLSRRAAAVCLSLEASASHFPRGAKLVVTGNPVRAEIAALGRECCPEKDSRVLLVLGGSQGAATLNDAVLEFVRQSGEALRGWRIVHQTGQAQLEAVRARYAELGNDAEVAAFFDDMAARYRAASLVISRAGGTTLAELACAGLPAVLVPYPFATADHQRANAEAYVAAGAARLVTQADAATTAQALATSAGPLLQDESERDAMRSGMRSLARPNAIERVVAEIERLMA